jgi:membrane protein
MDNDLTTAAAAISYFSMLALFPTFLLMLALGNRLIGPDTVEKYVISQAMTFFPNAERLIRSNLESITEISTSVIISCFLVMLWAATWIFTVIEKALNRIWGTAPRSFLHGRAVNFAVMSLLFVLLGVSAISTTIVTALRAEANNLPVKLSQQFAALGSYFWQSIFIAVSAAITIILFTMLYKFLPNTKVPLKEALIGASIAGILWEGAKFIFAYFLPYLHYDLLYGSIGIGVALLTWVYVSSLIMLFGAQFTALLHREHLIEASINKSRPLGKPVTGELPAAVNE